MNFGKSPMQQELERRERQERVQNARLRASQTRRMGSKACEYVESWNLQAHTTFGENLCLRCITHNSGHRPDTSDGHYDVPPGM
jgi:hypothetical protein